MSIVITVIALETILNNDETRCQKRSGLSGALGPAQYILQPTFLIVWDAVFEQAAELVAIEMQEAQLVAEWGFLQDTWDDTANAVLRNGQAQSQGQCGGQVDLLHHSRRLHSHWR